MELKEAIKLVRDAGYSVSKRKPRRRKYVGPTCVTKFCDGSVTRMTTHCADDALDYERGARLAKAAWLARHGTTFAPLNRAPEIAEMHFERAGKVLGRLYDVTTITPLAA